MLIPPPFSPVPKAMERAAAAAREGAEATKGMTALAGRANYVPSQRMQVAGKLKDFFVISRFSCMHTLDDWVLHTTPLRLTSG
jgi:hypothetical protein